MKEASVELQQYVQNEHATTLLQSFLSFGLFGEVSVTRLSFYIPKRKKKKREKEKEKRKKKLKKLKKI